MAASVGWASPSLEAVNPTGNNWETLKLQPATNKLAMAKTSTLVVLEAFDMMGVIADAPFPGVTVADREISQ